MNYLLSDYSLSKKEIVQSFFISTYGRRHLDEAKKNPHCHWGHRLIALIEFCPVIGQIATLIERITAKIWRSRSKNHVQLTPNRVAISVSIATPPKPIPTISPYPLGPPSAKEPGRPIPPSPTAPIATQKPSVAQLIVRGSQYGCNGKVPRDKVAQVFRKIHANREPGVTFNPAKIDGNIKDGTCTAMALDFIKNYFEARKVTHLSSSSSPDLFVNCIRSFGHKYADSSEEMKITQAAFNTIEEDKNRPTTDFKRAKIQSLANFHDLAIDISSNEINYSIQPLCSQQLREEVNKLPQGVYLLRTIEPMDNERKEKHGHSLVYIKESSVGFFYDPNFGITQLAEGNHNKTLNDNLFFNLAQFQTTHARFYRMSPKYS
jgi:hypothetical protein